MKPGSIRVGIGGWNYAPWRGAFYPQDLPQSRELEYASRHVTAIEINTTFYRLQKPDSFAKWAATTPDDFVFAIKGSRFCTNRKNLPEAASSLERFFAQGLEELGNKLGPFLWQLMPTKKFDAEEIAAFLALLPRKLGKQRLRHALEVRNASFLHPELLAVAREAGVAVVYAESDEYPRVADCTSDFVYLRLRNAREEEPLGLPRRELDAWAQAARDWSEGRQPPKLPRLEDCRDSTPRDVFLFVINGAKLRAPAAAMALLETLAAAPAPARRPRSARKSGA